MSEAEQEAAGCVHRPRLPGADRRPQAPSVSGRWSATAPSAADGPHRARPRRPALARATRRSRAPTASCSSSRAPALARLRHHRQRRHLVLSAMRHFAAELRERGEIEVDERRGVERFADVLAGRARRRLRGAQRRAGRGGGSRARGVRFVPSTPVPDRRRTTSPTWAGGRKRPRDGGLLPRPAPAPRAAARRRREAGGRPLELRQGEPAAAAGTASSAPPPWLAARRTTIDAEVRRDLDAMGLRRVGRGRRRARGPPRRAEARARARRLRRAPGGAVRPVAGRDGPGRALAVPLAAVVARSTSGCWTRSTPCRAAEARLPRRPARRSTSAEGFIRQIVGWREYVWGMYWLREGAWRADDALGAGAAAARGLLDGRDGRELPARVRDATCASRAYAHHIQRLMVLGNLHAAARRAPVGGRRVVPAPRSSTAPSG